MTLALAPVAPCPCWPECGCGFDAIMQYVCARCLYEDAVTRLRASVAQFKADLGKVLYQAMQA